MDFGPIVLAFAQKASITDLVMILVVALLAYLLREERKGRHDDAAAMTAAMVKMADAIDKFGNIVTELRITVARGGN